MTGLDRTARLFRSGVLEYVRTPVLLVVLAGVPAYVVGFIVNESSSAATAVDVPGTGTVLATSSDVFGAFMVPHVAALVGGVFGVFLMQTVRDADARLSLTDYRPSEVIAARLGVLSCACALVSAVAVLVLLPSFVPARPGLFVAATLASALVYGMVGLLVGTVLDRLPGVYVMLFVPTIDLFLFQNPVHERSVPGADLLPGNALVEAAMVGGFGDRVAFAPLAVALVYLVALVGLASLAFRHTVHGAG